MFDPTVSLGNILTIISFLSIAIGHIAFTRSELMAVKEKLTDLKDVLIDLAKQEGRMDRIEDRQTLQGGRIDEAISAMNHTRARVENIIDRGTEP